ncbi:MAG: hypothetical protein CMD46_02110 [Gammaproteobacteria bacterium]|nr:hypothetical protein [Gammaproteobacteria bacterium]
MLALPVIAMDSLTNYLVMPLGEMTQPEDFVEFFESNSLIIALVGIVGLIMQISFVGGLWIGFMSIDRGKTINPISALQAGFFKFLPLFGAHLVIFIVSALGFLMLILPGIYLMARFSLFAAQIMFEDNKVFESIGASWEKTDEYGSKLFMFTLVFFLLIISSALLLSSIIPTGIIQTVILSLIEYIFVVPLGYIYFTLYKSIKAN